jgi:hypothetical protein
VVLKDGQGPAHEPFQLRILHAFFLLLELINVLLMVLHHGLNVFAIKIRAGELRELVKGRNLLVSQVVRPLDLFVVGDLPLFVIGLLMIFDHLVPELFYFRIRCLFSGQLPHLDLR